jgi:hypothetical protein
MRSIKPLQEASRMFSTTTHKILVTLAVSAGFAGTLVPAASAADNSGNVAKGQTRATEKQCDMYKEWYDGDVKAKDDKGAKYDKNLAGERGCKWAALRRPPRVLRPGLGGIKVGPSTTSAPPIQVPSGVATSRLR